MDLDKDAKKWLEEHADKLPPEELPFEEEKTYIKEDGTWPVPKAVPDMQNFQHINTPNEFNKIVGDPRSWQTILNRQDLFEQWILPHAVLLFSKLWFDKVKWRHTISAGVPFPLFSLEDKQEAAKRGISLEDTQMGRAIITSIVSKTSYALHKYLFNKIESGKVRKNENPGGYIIGAIKNELIEQVGLDVGYRLKSVTLCPLCLSGIKGTVLKTPLIECGSNIYTCPKCKHDALQLEISNDNQELLNKLKYMETFYGASCICTNNKCSGKFIPVDLLGIPRNVINPTIGTQVFRKLPKDFWDIRVTCPFCNIEFIIEKALLEKSGFKDKSGHITGLPKMLIWDNSDITLDTKNSQSIVIAEKTPSNVADVDLQIVAQQRLEILMGEILLRMNKVKRDNVTGLTSWFFYKSVLEWMIQYWDEATRYFFGWETKTRYTTLKEMERTGETTKRVTKVAKGQEVSIHRCIFSKWVNMLENNIYKFKSISSISKLEDLYWFCRKPKFSGGPKSVFRVKVKNNKIINNSDIVLVNKKGLPPRLAKIYSIYKINRGKIDRSYNFVNDIKICEWQAIRMNNGVLKDKEQVRVEALMLPGHHSHAPIQRITRLRSSTLNDIICRILEEENTGERDLRFWEDWENRVEIARKNLLKENEYDRR